MDKYFFIVFQSGQMRASDRVNEILFLFYKLLYHLFQFFYSFLLGFYHYLLLLHTFYQGHNKLGIAQSVKIFIILWFIYTAKIEAKLFGRCFYLLCYKARGNGRFRLLCKAWFYPCKSNYLLMIEGISNRAELYNRRRSGNFFLYFL